MARFFIDNPVLAWVIAIFITLAGALSLPSLPVAQYPDVAPPQVTISTRFAGASPEDLYQQVTRPIEEELNGIPNLLYFESTSEATGAVTITVTFASGSSVSQAVVETQNRLRRVESSLPPQVQQEGLLVEEAGSSYLMFVSLAGAPGSGYDSVGLADYATRFVLNEIRRVEGVGKAQLFSADPFVDAEGYDLRLSAPTEPGVSLDHPFAGSDLSGADRGVDGGWDRGAFEHSL